MASGRIDAAGIDEQQAHIQMVKRDVNHAVVSSA